MHTCMLNKTQCESIQPYCRYDGISKSTMGQCKKSISLSKFFSPATILQQASQGRNPLFPVGLNFYYGGSSSCRQTKVSIFCDNILSSCFFPTYESLQRLGSTYGYRPNISLPLITQFAKGVKHILLSQSPSNGLKLGILPCPFQQQDWIGATLERTKHDSNFSTLQLHLLYVLTYCNNILVQYSVKKTYTCYFKQLT
eukprot:TRINITY_DN19249_c0_g2_i3.p1 TRINITY_DN19249_c0_g2~~TRINITY_DN19249_c0_g2_i3.p1  ORF type:complete len:198 (+),score=-9.45 TRINITY_DN19249_c0_g2_i3:652-1245(+)